LVLALFAGTAGAAVVVNPTGVTGHDGGNWPNTLGHLTDMLNGNNVGFLTGDHAPGMDTSPDPSDPSQWLYSPSGWPNEWKANTRLDPSTSSNAKIGWAVIDLGSTVAALDKMYLWNVRWQNTTENVATYNVYHATSPAAALPAMPNSKQTTGDYDFSSGGWFLLNGAAPLSLPVNTANGNPPQGTVNLGGISAQYIALEILTAGNATPTPPPVGEPYRIGLAQVEITQIPEPATMALMGLGGLVIRRRRRAE